MPRRAALGSSNVCACIRHHVDCVCNVDMKPSRALVVVIEDGCVSVVDLGTYPIIENNMMRNILRIRMRYYTPRSGTIAFRGK